MDARENYLTEASYRALYKQSIDDPDFFWADQARNFIDWVAPWIQVKKGGFSDADWFIQGKLNACYNCVDRHLKNQADDIAILWEGDSPEHIRRITYDELHQAVCRFANLLKQYGVKKGDNVCIYMPMIPEVAFAMLACARIGAVHSVVFSGFSPDALKTRILDVKARFLITTDEGLRGGKTIPLKENADKALIFCPDVEKVIVVKHTHHPIPWHEERDVCYHTAIQQVTAECPAEVMDANDPLFILHTSGSTGKPKGVLHATGGYLVYAAITHHYIFNYHPGEVYWCSADIGWITGHTYLIYGPLLNGATTVMYEGTPQYPNYARFWDIIDRHQVNIFYTSPTALRALRKQGDEWLTHTSRASLRLLGTVGEPINPDVWQWYYHVVGNDRCPIVDTWWQTETGGALITPIPGVMPLKAGSAARPFFGIKPAIVDEKGELVANGKSGQLVIQAPWPGMMKTIYGDPQRFLDNYFHKIPGNYLTGDCAHQDSDGYYWIAGRDDDIIKVSGHRLGTGELESAFLQHPAVSEAAVVAIPHEIKGQGIYAYISLKKSIVQSDVLKSELIQHIRVTIGSIATPEVIQWAQDLPKTRSGKIMRRILRQIAMNELDNFGDLSTLADPEVMASILLERKNIPPRHPERSEGSPAQRNDPASGDPSSQAPRDDVQVAK